MEEERERDGRRERLRLDERESVRERDGRRETETR